MTSLADFGAFVNVNGADGLVHLSEISWDRVQHPSEVLEVGQEVKVKVINIDREKRRIGLSIRALQSDPWQSKVEKFKVGQLVEGVITRLTKFGAFARLEGDLEGLIHISEISENRIEHPKEAGLHEGDVVTLRVIRIDPDQRRIGLSLRKVDSGAFKDLDLKQINLEGVSLEMADDNTPAPKLHPLPMRAPAPGRASYRRETGRWGNPRTVIPKPGFSRSRVFYLPMMQPSLIVDAHEDLAYNMLTFGRDYTRSAAETRRLETASGFPDAVNITTRPCSAGPITSAGGSPSFSAPCSPPPSAATSATGIHRCTPTITRPIACTAPSWILIAL